jgi:hypothetical protein
MIEEHAAHEPRSERKGPPSPYEFQKPREAEPEKERSFFEGLEIVPEPEEREEKFGGVVTAQVVATFDPTKPGKIQIRLPFLDATEPVWARVAAPMASVFAGMSFLPNIGDEVLVTFEHGDIRHPYVIGGLWNVLQLPPPTLPGAQTRVIRTVAGNQIVFNDTPPSITIQAGPTLPVPIPAPSLLSPATITLSATGITMEVGGTTLAITAAGIVMTAPNVSITGSASVTVFGGVVNIN